MLAISIVGGAALIWLVIDHLRVSRQTSRLLELRADMRVALAEAAKDAESAKIAAAEIKKQLSEETNEHHRGIVLDDAHRDSVLNKRALRTEASDSHITLRS